MGVRQENEGLVPLSWNSLNKLREFMAGEVVKGLVVGAGWQIPHYG